MMPRQSAKNALVGDIVTSLGQDSEKKLNWQLIAYKPSGLILIKSTEMVVRDEEH